MDLNSEPVIWAKTSIKDNMPLKDSYTGSIVYSIL